MGGLKKLSINSCNLTIPCLEELKKALIDTSDLEAINLYSNEIDAEGAQLIAQMLVNKLRLKHLGLSNNIIGQGGARELAQICLQTLPSLTRLSMESNLIGNSGLEGIAKALVQNETLEELFLYNNDLDDDMMLELSKTLVNKERLVTLGLEYNRIRSRGANHIFDAVKLLPRFERMFVSHNLINQDSGEQIRSLLKESRSLKELRLNNNPQIGDEAGALITEGLLASKTIRVCHMSDTKISGLAADKLCEVIKDKHHPLKDLDISNNLIIMDDIEMLANAFKQSTMECFNIRNNIVSAEEIVAFEHLLVPVTTMTKRKFIF